MVKMEPTHIEHKKSPAECRSLEDIRAEINHLDQAMIALIGLRAQYVQAAAAFKISKQAVRAPERASACHAATASSLGAGARPQPRRH